MILPTPSFTARELESHSEAGGLPGLGPPLKSALGSRAPATQCEALSSNPSTTTTKKKKKPNKKCPGAFIH
jgi:hypothetical protein